MKQFEVKITKMCWLFEDSMGLVAVSSSGQDHGKIITGMSRGITKITTHHHSGVVEQGTLPFPYLIHFKKKAIKMLECINLNFT